MKKFVALFLFLLIPSAVLADGLPKGFDPIPGIEVNENGISAPADAVVELSKKYSVVGTTAASNSGKVTSKVEYTEGKLKVPSGTELIISGDASGNLNSTTVEEDIENFPTAIITLQKNKGEIRSVGNFSKSPEKDETRSISASGNKITYRNENNNKESKK